MHNLSGTPVPQRRMGVSSQVHIGAVTQHEQRDFCENLAGRRARRWYGRTHRCAAGLAPEGRVPVGRCSCRTVR